MAGAGYKLFNTGDVLTAAQVNTYLMEQTVMVFADATARTAALSGVVSEGMISYLKDTNAVEVYDGSNWVSSDDPNAIQNTIVDAKGDLISATAADTPARLAVGNNGETLVADSSATTGLRWQGNFSAGKNKIINGDFNIWQRGTSFTPTSGSFSADRFYNVFNGSGSTRTVSRQTFTPGTAPVSGYESAYFLRYAVTVAGSGETYSTLSQNIEDVRTLAGQTATFSFWAKAASNITLPAVYAVQRFGSGGSAEVATTLASSVAVTTSWQRFSYTFTMPSVSGKTIGTGSYVDLEFYTPLNSTFTLDTWGWQLESGNTATAFQTATGTLAGELAACQRYFQTLANNVNIPIGIGFYYSATQVGGSIHLTTEMRTSPTISQVTGTNYYNFYRNGTNDGFNSLTIDQAGTRVVAVYNNTEVSGTAGQAGNIFTANASTFLAMQAEL